MPLDRLLNPRHINISDLHAVEEVKISARTLLTPLKDTSCYNREDDLWSESSKDMLSRHIRFISSRVQLFGLLVEGRLGAAHVEARYRQLKSTVLFDRERDMWRECI